MERYEVKFDNYLQILYRRKFMLIGCIITAIAAASVVNFFFIKKQYETNVWIKLVDPAKVQKQSSLEYIKLYFLNPEVVSAVIPDSAEISEIKRNICFREINNNLTQISLFHSISLDGEKIMRKWYDYAMLVMVREESQVLQQSLKEDIVTAKTQLTQEEQRSKRIMELLDDEPMYGEVQDSSTAFLLVEPNPIYTDLAIELNDVKLAIIETQQRLEFMEEVLEEYQVVMQNMQEAFTDSQANVEDYFVALEEIRTKYNVYLQLKKAGTEAVIIKPFLIISGPYQSPESVNPNIPLGIFLGGVLGLVFGIFVALSIEYYQNGKQSLQNRPL